MSKMKVVLVTDSLNYGGIETYIVNLCRNINKSKFDVSVILLDESANGQQAVLEGLGVKVEALTGGKMRRAFSVSRLIVALGRPIVHFQSRHTLLLVLAKFFGAKVVLHSHFGYDFSKQQTFLKVRLQRFLLRISCKLLLACGKVAGDGMFLGLDYEIALNGVDAGAFIFNEVSRREIRSEFNIDLNTKVILQVGRLNYNKNQIFTTKLLELLLDRDTNYRLICVGEGEGRSELEAVIYDHGLSDVVILAGARSDVNKFYSAADVLVQPSLHEGLPYTLIEAQFCTLPCVASLYIDHNVNISGGVDFVDLTDINQWREVIMRRTNLSLNDRRSSGWIEASGYNVKVSVAVMEQWYESLYNE